MNSVDRFKRRKKILKDLDKSNGLSIDATPETLKAILNFPVDVDAVRMMDREFNNIYDFKFDVDVTDQEADELLKIREKDFDTQKFDDLVRSCRNDILYEEKI